MLSIVFGLCSALAWGAGDFLGGVASRRLDAYRVVLYGELTGLAVLAGIIAVTPQPAPDLYGLLLAAAAGMIGSIGLLVLYRSMAVGKMSIAAPISALLAAILPVVVGALTEGIPGPAQLAGFALALAAVWLISQGQDGQGLRQARLADLLPPLLAGICFGAYFVIIHQVTQESTFYPMVASRLAGALMLAAVVGWHGAGWTVPRRSWGILAANGSLDVLGNLFYILAGQAGRLDVAAVLSALYPGGTVVLARLFLHERIARLQAAGIGLALAAIVLLTF